MEKEIRILNNSELRADNDGESRIIEGYAIRFDEWSRDLGGFYELIHSESITNELVMNSDIIMNVNHDDDKMVARWNKGNGTLSLELRAEGLYFQFVAPQTELGNELLFNVRSGNLFECSFAFSLPEGSTTAEKWYKDIDGTLRREIFEIGGLYDCAVVAHAAYPTTSVSARSAQKKAEAEEIDKAMDAIMAEINEI